MDVMWMEVDGGGREGRERMRISDLGGVIGGWDYALGEPRALRIVLGT